MGEFVRCLAREFKCYFPENATEELYENKVAPNASLTTFNLVVETSGRGQAEVRDVMCLKLYCDRHLRCLAVNECISLTEKLWKKINNQHHFEKKKKKKSIPLKKKKKKKKKK